VERKGNEGKKRGHNEELTKQGPDEALYKEGGVTPELTADKGSGDESLEIQNNRRVTLGKRYRETSKGGSGSGHGVKKMSLRTQRSNGWGGLRQGGLTPE